MEIKAFHDPETFTLTYVLWNSASGEALVIDPVLDYEFYSSKLSKNSAMRVIHFLKESKLKPLYVLETHAHADHLSGSQILKEEFPGLEVAIGSKITEVQSTFKNIYHLDDSFKPDGSQFDRLLNSYEEVKLGRFSFKVLPTPGHTPACCSYLFNEGLVFTGDALFMPDYGTGRCDFPAGSASDLYDSIQKQLYSLPDETRVFTGHDYLPNGRSLQYESTIGKQKNQNIRIKKETSLEDFVRFREKRDSELKPPKLLLPSLQVNINAGRLPPAESNGRSYLRFPLEWE